MKTALALCTTLIVSGCAGTSVVQTSGNTAIVTARAAPVCGGVGAERVAVREAAIETIKAGFDKYIIYDAAAQNTVTATQMPGTYTTMGTVNGGMLNATTTYQPGPTIYSGNHSQAFAIKMFKASDPAGANAVDARTTLGPEWPKLIKQGSLTTCT
ncbi:hypothetical protein EOA79_04515 [Mesorhizobium sp. M1A.F.Ca.IN.020.03.2.1]|uniref:hypothetical protein n=1 Tax=Mesorhizobium sp. M1A.F.Ca.IN.020.03.2.1 TaxID=2496769 RepID=UPI000FD2D0C5|nr:hypothetical protein [Mesorhizobium sp. M1A.F.Ca.IN.020.03.2.1]RUV07434.1 hypothetical protein EOA79_04515 [Mesorhizobium sp. M1A.F.Ca.IN.020.03.2.1]